MGNHMSIISNHKFKDNTWNIMLARLINQHGRDIPAGSHEQLSTAHTFPFGASDLPN